MDFKETIDAKNLERKINIIKGFSNVFEEIPVALDDFKKSLDNKPFYSFDDLKRLASDVLEKGNVDEINKAKDLVNNLGYRNVVVDKTVEVFYFEKAKPVVKDVKKDEPKKISKSVEEHAKDITDEDLKKFIDKYPDSPHTPVAKKELEGRTKKVEKSKDENKTKSGKNIEGSFSDSAHKDYDKNDHSDAHDHHNTQIEKLYSKKKSLGEEFSKEDAEALKNHITQKDKHRDAYRDMDLKDMKEKDNK